MERRIPTSATVRRLVLELGLKGDVDAKAKLEDFKKAGDALKATLNEIEKSLYRITRGLAQIPSLGQFTQPILTGSEQRQVEQREQLRRQQEQALEKRDREQLTLSKQNLELQKRVIEALQEQAKGQDQIISELLQRKEGEGQFLGNILNQTEAAVRQSIAIIEKRFIEKDQPIEPRVGGIPEKHFKISGIKVLDPESPTGYWETGKQKARMALTRGVKQFMEDVLSDIDAARRAISDPDLSIGIRSKMEALSKSVTEATELMTKALEAPIDDFEAELERIKAEREQIVRGFIPVSKMEPTPPPEPRAITQLKQQERIITEIKEPIIVEEPITILPPPESILVRTEQPEPLPPLTAFPPPGITPEGEYDPTTVIIREELNDLEDELKRIKSTRVEIGESLFEALSKASPLKQEIKIPELPSIPGPEFKPEGKKLGAEMAQAIKEFFLNRPGTGVMEEALQLGPKTSVEMPIVQEFLRLTGQLPKEETEDVDVGKMVAEMSAARVKRVLSEQKSAGVRRRITERDVRIAEEAIDIPALRRGAIIKQIQEDLERQRITKEVERVQSGVRPTLEREAKIKERGFTFEPAERLFEKKEDVRGYLESRQQEIKEGLIRRLTGIRIGKREYQPFKTAEQALKEKGKVTEAEAEAEIGKQGDVINKYSFNFQNTIIDSEERKEQLIREIVMALRG